MTGSALIVDDSSMARRSSLRVLEGFGLTVEAAADGLEALEKYSLVRPDFVLLDIVMSGMYGLEVLTELKKLDPGVRVIFATADVQELTRKDVKAAGAAGLVNKPLNPDELRATIERVLRGENTWT